MLKTRKTVFAEFHKVYHTEVGKILNHRLDTIDHFFESIEKDALHFRKYVSDAKVLRKKGFLEEYNQLLIKLLQLNNSFYNNPNVESYIEMNEQFIQARLKIINNTAEYVDGVQDEKSFVAQTDDGVYVKFRKTMRRGTRSIQNVFRKKDNGVVWKRKIPLRHYAYLHFSVVPVAELWNMVIGILKLETRDLKELKFKIDEIDALFSTSGIYPKKEILLEKLDNFIDDISKYSNFFKGFRSSVPKRIDTILEYNIQQFDANYYKAGTFELPKRKLKEAKLEKRISKKRKVLTEEFNRWETTLFSYSEDWNFDLELFIVKASTLVALVDFQKGDAIAKERSVLRNLKVISEKLQSIHLELKKTKAGTKTFIAKIDQYRSEIEVLLNEDALKLVEGNDEKPLLVIGIINLKTEIERIVNNISNSRMVPKGNVMDGELKMNDLISVHPRDLIQFEILPKIQYQFLEFENTIKDKIVEFEVSLIDLAHFVDYNLESARSYFDKEDASIKDVKEISTEGLLLGVEKVSKAAGDIKQLYGNTIAEIKEGLVNYENSIISLTENANVSELRIRLLKAKAINKSVELKDEFIEFLIRIWDKTREKTLIALKRGTGVSEQLSKMYYQAGYDGSVNADISNFLAETKNAIDKLPYIYQRLFKLDPVSSGYLFFKRQAELITMRNAYHNWRLNRFASLVVLGEKGAGVTSMIEHFLTDIPYTHTVVDLKSIEEPYKVVTFLSIFTEQLGLKPVNSFKELIDQIANFEEKRVVLVEGLQYLYLRKVDGFECLKLFFELSSQTNKNIFWVASGTIHAWNYLDKVLGINEYFGYVVKLGEFSNDDMIEIVSKRHKVSGYDLQFLPSKVDLANSKYTKLTAEEKQAYLRKIFFQQLNVLAKGNISVALIFWLRSSGGIKDNTLLLKSMHDFDSSFIKGLGKEKLFSLHAVLLHDGLTVSDFCKVMRYKPEIGQMKLMQMFDDGLLLKFRDRYVINFLLYRAVINALKSQNILH